MSTCATGRRRLGNKSSDAGALRSAIRIVPDFPVPGIPFRDIMPVLSDPALLDMALKFLVRPYAGHEITKVVGIESRGFLLGTGLALRLGVGFAPVRKKGKLPGETVRVAYGLEYGTDEIEMQVDALQPGDLVLIHDDVIATGGTAAACHKLVALFGASVVGYSFLMELAYLNGRARLPGNIPIRAVLVD